MMKWVATVVALLVVLSAGLPAQDSPFSKKKQGGGEEEGGPGGGSGGGVGPDDDKDAKPAKPAPGKKPSNAGGGYNDNYAKALTYIKEHYASRDWRLIPSLFAGLVFLLDGRPELQADLDRVIERAIRGIHDDKAFNGNWFVAYSAFFLAVVYQHFPRADIKQALEEGIEVADRTREDDTLGWGHNKGWGTSSGYYKKGGAKDLGIVTATMLAGYLIAREAGIKVPDSFIERTMKNLESIQSGGSISYGTANRWTGPALSRSAQAYVGLKQAGMTSSSIFTTVDTKLADATQHTESGHAYGPIHFFACAIALQMQGKYATYGNHWLPILSDRQDASGATAMQHDGGKRGDEEPELGATAVYALMILLNKGKKVVLPPKKGGGDKAGGGGGGGGSPFGKPKEEKPETKPQQTESAEKKKNPFGKD